MNMLSNCAFNAIMSESTAGSTDVEGSATMVVDVAGYEGVCFVGYCHTVTAAGILGMWAQYGISTSATDIIDDTGTIVGSTGATTSTDWTDKLLVLDIYKPTERYVSVHIDRATQPSAIDVIAIRYGAHKLEVSQSTDHHGVIDSGLFVSPTT